MASIKTLKEIIGDKKSTDKISALNFLVATRTALIKYNTYDSVNKDSTEHDKILYNFIKDCKENKYGIIGENIIKKLKEIKNCDNKNEETKTSYENAIISIINSFVSNYTVIKNKF